MIGVTIRGRPKGQPRIVTPIMPLMSINGLAHSLLILSVAYRGQRL
jgi:hypothetical protein